MQRITGDERHRIVVSGFAPLLLGARLSLIATAASPRPYLTIVGVDLNRNGFPFDDWIDARRYRMPDGSWRNWYRVVDVRLSRDVTFHRARMTAMVEAFNVFNTENYASFDGTLRSEAGDNQRFGRPSGVFGTRQLQLGARVAF
jgi:hypothetical protein